MNTLPMTYLFKMHQGKAQIKDKLFIHCNKYHPNTSRLVVLSESPCEENKFKSVSVLARFIGGRYYGVTTGDELPVILDHTTWTESSIAEGPYRIIEDGQYFRNGSIFTDLNEAYAEANNLNMQTFGDPGYTVVNEYGIPVDRNGHLYF